MSSRCNNASVCALVGSPLRNIRLGICGTFLSPGRFVSSVSATRGAGATILSVELVIWICRTRIIYTLVRYSRAAIIIASQMAR